MAYLTHNTQGGWAVRWITAENKKKQKSFRTKGEAKLFLAQISLAPEEKRKSITVRELFSAYRDEVSSKKKGGHWEELRIDLWLRQPWADKAVVNLTPQDIERHFAERKISDATVRRELTLMSSIFNDGIRREIVSENPVRRVVKPKEPEHRERIASEEDKQALLAAAGWDGESVPSDTSQLTVAAFLFACATGMRSGEILRLEEAWIDGRVIHLPKEATKTDSRRDVALSTEALRILALVKEAGHRPQIFGMSDQVRDQVWRRVRDRAGLGPRLDSAGRVIEEGLNFHDSRATFATWAASPDPRTGAPRLDVLALARQTGHRNLKMLQRYYRASPEQIADRLDQACGQGST